MESRRRKNDDIQPVMTVDGEALQIKDQYLLGEIAQGAQDFAHLVGSSAL